MCRMGYVQTVRAVGLTGGNPAVRAFREELPDVGRLFSYRGFGAPPRPDRARSATRSTCLASPR